ncbi:MAG TPA: transglycosylase SLT domain-containing protein [Pseudonocardia sp.]
MVPARHLIAGTPPPSAPSLRTTVIVSAAAVGAVATGTVSALIPGGPSLPTAAADESATLGSLSASTTALLRNPATEAIGTLSPVLVGTDGPGTDGPGFAGADQHLALLGKATDIAAQIAEAHQKELAAQADAARIEAAVSQGGLDSWIAQALQILNLPQTLAPGVKRIVLSESGGNPHAINLTDSNARRGTPSQGLMQTIPTTFRHYVAPQVANRPITDPVANITAGVNYMVTNYGVGTVAAGGRSNSLGSYIGY